MSTTASDRRLVTIVLVLIGALVVLPVLTMGFWTAGGPMMGGSFGHMWGDGATAPWWVLLVGVVMQLLFLGVLVAAGYLIYRAVTRQDTRRDPALDELRMAYARGDLSEEEYESRRRRLEEE